MDGFQQQQGSNAIAATLSSTADPEAAALSPYANPGSVPPQLLQQQSLPQEQRYKRLSTAAARLAKNSFGLGGLQPVTSGSVAGSQGLQDASQEDLVDPWGRDATSDDFSGAVVLAEETFMQHVTRVYKVSKHVWDYYTKLSKQTVMAPADGTSRETLDNPLAWQNPASDPTAFRFRTTFEDVPSARLQSISRDPRLATTSRKLGTTSFTLAAASTGMSQYSVSAALWQQQQQQERQQQQQQQGQQQQQQGFNSNISTNDVVEGVPSEPVQLQLRLRPSIFLLPVVFPEHRLACVWSLFMLCMDMVYIAFVMPLSMAFCPVVPGGLNWCGTIDLVAGLVYMINLMMSFQIGFILEHDYKKRMLLDGLHVARFYVLRGTFFIDFMATLPVIYQVVMVSGRIYNYWANRCLTFTMLLRLLRLVQLMKVLFVDSLITSGNTGLSRYISVLGQYALVALYAAAVLVHNLACLAWLIALMEGPYYSWAKTVQWASGGEGTLPESPPMEQYLAALYWVFTTVTTTGYGDITPQTPLDALLCMLFMLCGVSMVALLIGSMTELLTQATSDARRARTFRQKMTEVEEWLTRRNIPGKLRAAIRNYYNQVWLHHQDHSTEAAILSQLPTALRGRVAQHITAGLLDGLPIMQGLDGAVREDLASRLVPVEVAPGHELCREGDEANCVWLLQEGELLYIRGAQPIQLLGPPCLLGEYCLLADEVPALQYRPASLRALSSCQLWMLSLRELHTLMVHHPELEERLMAAARESVARHYDVITANGSDRLAGGHPQQQQPQQGSATGAEVAAAGPGLNAWFGGGSAAGSQNVSSADPQRSHAGSSKGVAATWPAGINRSKTGFLAAQSVPIAAAAAAAGRRVLSSSANGRSSSSRQLNAGTGAAAATVNDNYSHRPPRSRGSSRGSAGNAMRQLHAASMPLSTVYSTAVSGQLLTQVHWQQQQQQKQQAQEPELQAMRDPHNDCD